MRLLPPPHTISFALIATLAACSDEVPQIPKEELYAREFVKQFGVPAQEHSWSMAATVDAEISIGRNSDGTVTFLTGSPSLPSTRILAVSDLRGGRCRARFETEAGMKSVYIVATEHDGCVVYSGYADILGANIDVADACGRASEACPVTATPVTDFMVNTIKTDPQEALKVYLREYLADKIASGEKITSDDISEIKWYDLFTWSQQRDDVPSIYSVETESVSVPNLFQLDNYDFSLRTPEFSVNDVLPITYGFIGTKGRFNDGVFCESYDTNKESNTYKYYHRDKVFDPEVSVKVKDNGPVELDLVWRAPENKMIWGYYYYDESEENDIFIDPMSFYNKVRKYIVFNGTDDERNPHLDKNTLLEGRLCTNRQNHSVVNFDSDHQPVIHYQNPNDCADDDAHTLADTWEPIGPNYTKTIYNQEFAIRGARLRGARIRLVYFGKDGDGAASYDFPKGTKIGFFTCGYEGKKFRMSHTNVAYFVHVQRATGNYLGPESNKKAMDSPFAVKYNFNGSTYVGFEENTDNDLNDLIFRASNVEKGKDITPDNFPEPEEQEWILACEDLGTTDDYDFNDIVVKLRYVSGTGEAVFTPVACGGTLLSDIYLGSEGENPKYWGEIHEMLGVEPGVMAGTGNGTAEIDHSGVQSATITVAKDATVRDVLENLRIHTIYPGSDDKVHGEWGEWATKEEYVSENPALRVPRMLILPASWRWPKERVSITDAYEGFRGWVGNPEDNADWPHNGIEDNLYLRTD